jgi:hypothetical protein
MFLGSLMMGLFWLQLSRCYVVFFFAILASTTQNLTYVKIAPIIAIVTYLCFSRDMQLVCK